jgi:hypothetical protein
VFVASSVFVQIQVPTGFAVLSYMKLPLDLGLQVIR